MSRREAEARIEEVEAGAVGEWVGGELVVTPRGDATRIARILALALGGPSLRFGHFRFLVEPRLELGPDLLAPPLAAWRMSRMPQDLAAPRLAVAPWWVAEILSPENARAVRAAKMPAYALASVEWAWLLDPWAHTLEIYRRMGDRWLVEGTVAGEAAVVGAPFGERAVDLGALWQAEAAAPAP